VGGDDAANVVNKKSSAGVRCRRACGWRDKYAFSLGHLDSPPFNGLGLGTQGRMIHALALCRYITYITRMTQVLIRPTDDPKDTTLQMRVSASFLKKIDDWRRSQPDLPSRAEAIRRLVDASLEATPKKGSKK
jgi:hypothetical protein